MTCSCSKSACIDSRKLKGGTRRRKKCLSCGRRWTTYEVEMLPEEFTRFMAFWTTARDKSKAPKREAFEFLVGAGILDSYGQLTEKYRVANPGRVQRKVKVASGDNLQLGQPQPDASPMLHEVRREGLGQGRAQVVPDLVSGA